MRTKVPPSKLMGKALRAILSGETEAEDLLTEIMRRGTEQIIQESLEQEQAEFIGRDHYDRGERRAYRNGYQDKQLRTSAGRLTVRRPRVRCCEDEERFESAILARIDALEDRLVRLALEMYVRGLSTRDVEETLVDDDGSPLLSRSSVSRVADSLYDEYDAFARRDLSQLDVIYLFADGVYEAVKSYTNNQAILCAWGILADGTKTMLHLEAVSSESQAAWSDFFDNMLQRGLKQPLLVVSDGSAALRAAVHRTFPRSDRQRCIAHKLRNLGAKLPEDVRQKILNQAKSVYYAPDEDTARFVAERFIEDYSDRYPSMVKCFCEDLDACLVHLRYPLGHRKYIRTTNLLERAFVEEKRRTKTIPQHVNERGAVKLVFGALMRASEKWRRIPMTKLDLTQLRNIRKIMCPEIERSSTISFRLAA